VRLLNRLLGGSAAPENRADRKRQEITDAHKPCETAENGTGARCTCAFDCANYWLRARGYKQEGR
jgi:hypothetical protein